MINCKAKGLLVSILSFLVVQSTNGQAPVVIPAYTAYSLPAEESDANGDSQMFLEKSGIHNWTDPTQQVQFFFRLRKTGMLDLTLSIKNDKPGNKHLKNHASTLILPNIRFHLACETACVVYVEIFQVNDIEACLILFRAARYNLTTDFSWECFYKVNHWLLL